MGALAQLIGRIGLEILDKRPFSLEAKQRRQARRQQARAWRRARRDAEERGEPMPDTVTVTLPDGQQVTRAEPIIPARTSTKAAVVGVPGGFGVLEVLQSIDWPGMWFDGFLQTQAAAVLITALVSWVTARFVKSPTVPPTIL